jgi:uncharacterized protein (TIGR03000 family)
MFKPTLFFVKAAVLATAILAMTAGESFAQRGGHGGGGGRGGFGGGRGGFGGGRGFVGGRGYGGWGYGGWGYGLGYGGWGYGYPYYGYGGYYGGYAPYYGSGYYYDPSYYSSTTPYYDSTAAIPSTNYQSYYPAGTAATGTDPNSGMVEVRLPSADAQVWFNGNKTNQTGTVRRYSTPPLTAGQSHTYEVRATWMANGQPVTQTREINVQPGQPTVVNFTQ